MYVRNWFFDAAGIRIVIVALIPIFIIFNNNCNIANADPWYSENSHNPFLNGADQQSEWHQSPEDGNSATNDNEGAAQKTIVIAVPVVPNGGDKSTSQNTKADRQNSEKAGEESPKITDWLQGISAVVQAILAIIVGWFTALLYRTTARMWRVSERQANDLETSLRIAQENADAAKVSAEAAKNSFDAMALSNTVSLRAYIAHTGFYETVVWADETKVAYYTISSDWKNTGISHAINVVAQLDVNVFRADDDGPVPDQMINDKLKPGQVKDHIRTFTLHPNVEVERTSSVNISIEELMRLPSRRTRIFVIARVDYDDMLTGTGRHHTSVCYEVYLKGDPRTGQTPTGPQVMGFRGHWSLNSAT